MISKTAFGMMLKNSLALLSTSSSSSLKTPLGRWNIHNYKETSLKIKYANEDNCGVCCNNYNIKNDKLNDDEYIYLMGYESVHN